ncbi:Adaptive-response sensory-kinase SasA [anaerobic digester metagenome]
MKIRTRLTIIMLVFGLAVVIISASVVGTEFRMGGIEEREVLAEDLHARAHLLSDLSSSYLLLRDDRQLAQWRLEHAAFGKALVSLSADGAREQALCSALEESWKGLGDVFEEVAAGDGAGAGGVPAAWSQVAEVNRALVQDTLDLVVLIQDKQESVERQSTLLVSSLVAVFAAFLLVSYLLNFRQVLASIATLQEGTRAVGSGDLSFVLPAHGDDELGELGRSFNRMTADLRALTASRAELEVEVVQRTEVEDRLRRSLEALEQKEAELGSAAVFLSESPFPVMRLDGTGSVLYTNPAGEAVLEAWGIGRGDRFSPHLCEEVAVSLDLGVLRELEASCGPIVYSIAMVPIPDQGYVNLYFSEITRRKRAEAALEAQAERLRRSNEELERFAYVSSHDLQEPLRSVVSFSQLLQRRYRGRLGPDADEYIGFIVEAGVRMQALIQDLLQLSRVSTRGSNPRPVESGAVFEEVLRDLSPAIEASGGVVEHGPLPRVMADPTQLGQVFANLLSNALKFRRQDVPPRVRVSAEQDGRSWRFAVEDNGIGIEPEYFDRIFVIFQRLHTRDEYEGTGIGLALVARIVDLHGGRTWVESEPGRGSTFFFTLPAADKGPTGGMDSPSPLPGP